MDRYLQHYGIRGMKWGVRRKRPNYSPKRRKVSTMTDKELDQSLSRLRKEAEYKKLTKTRRRKALEYISRIPEDIMKQTINNAVTQPIVNQTTKYSKKGIHTVGELGKDFIQKRYL